MGGNEPNRVPLVIPVTELNGLDLAGFVKVIGLVFEESPWIAERTWPLRPFRNREALYAALCRTLYDAPREEQIRLIRAHPDLVGRAARAGALTAESTREQAVIGALSPDEVALFDRFNEAYRERFGFPFVICARENKKASILAAFPVRLGNTREEEITAALHEISKIAMFRLEDAVADH